MMLSSGYGDIMAPHLACQGYINGVSAEARIQDIKAALEDIRDNIESGFYPHVGSLRLHKEYRILPIVEKLLSSLLFYNGDALRTKIDRVEESELDSGAPIEFEIPLFRGYVDYNTTQAIYRINQDLRPDEFLSMWTVDKDFMEYLAEAYGA